MCTENLGCETGIIDYRSTSSEEDDDCQHLQDAEPLSPVRITGSLVYSRAKAEISRRSYPPPLTSMDRIKVKASREDGRLLIRAVPSYTSMHVERSDGRLLIRLVNTAPAAPSSSIEWEQDQYVEEGVHAEGSHIEDDEEEGEEMEEEGEERKDQEPMFLQFESGADRQNACGSCEMNGEREMGDVTDQKFQRPTRCKEGGHENKGLLSWGTFCVASS